MTSSPGVVARSRGDPCPECGQKYIGASATGKLRRYRYYTCYSRARYGRAGCTAPRVDADQLDTAVTETLLALYADTTVITDAITEQQHYRAERSQQHTTELAAIGGQIRAAEAAIDRYLTAFENRTLDETSCGHRIRDLTTKIGQLTTRQAELTGLLDTQPKPPSSAAIDQLRRDLAHVLDHGTPGQKKAIIGTHLAEIQIRGTQLIPIYKIPTDENGPAGTPADPTISRNIDVVDRMWQNPNRVHAVQGPIVTLVAVRRRIG